jgi:hypothetical protein
VAQARRCAGLTRAGAALLAASAALALACAAPWDPPGLRAHAAALAAVPGHRLRDATPYLLPWEGELVEFFCRFATEQPLGVHLPADATPDERRALRAALDAWQGAGLGVRFAEAPPERAQIAFEWATSAGSGRAEGTGYTLADCRLGDLSRAALSGERLPAHMARARIRIVRRDATGWSAADHAFFATELLGIALHELAHALGFQGHARFGGGLLAPDTRRSTAAARRLLAGEPLREPTLEALYRLPPGVVLARRAVPAVRTAPLDARVLEASGLEGPFVRVGDKSGRVFWRTAGGRERGVTLVSIATARAHPERLVLLPD